MFKKYNFVPSDLLKGRRMLDKQRETDREGQRERERERGQTDRERLSTTEKHRKVVKAHSLYKRYSLEVLYLMLYKKREERENDYERMSTYLPVQTGCHCI